MADGPNRRLAARPASSASTRPRSSSSTPALSSASRPASALSSLRPPSAASSTIRPSSSASIRPSSSAPLRPSSSASSRTLTSTLRPSSSASSVRPPSSTSRPTSRLSQRPRSRASSRLSARLLPLYQTLVTQTTGLEASRDAENFQTAVEFVARNLDQTTKPGVTSDMTAMEKHIRGHCQKARVNSNDTLANALNVAFGKLKSQADAGNDLDADMKTSRLPDHLQFLVLLSEPPTQKTLEYAEQCMEKHLHPKKPAAALTWQAILAEEPFEGQHWQGAYGLPPGSTVESWDTDSGGSTPSLSALDDSDDLEDEMLSLSGTSPQGVPPTEEAQEPRIPPRVTYSHRREVEDLQARQYWRSEWHTDASTSRPFDIGDASTLGPAIYRTSSREKNHPMIGVLEPKVIHEQDAVREVLMGLQGHNNMMLRWSDGGDQAYTFSPSLSHRLLHYSATLQESILAKYAEAATTLQYLRKFTTAVFASACRPIPRDPSTGPHFTSPRRRDTRTLEAFADAVDSQLREFDAWCAAREEEMCAAHAGVGPPLVVSLLNLQKSMQEAFSSKFAVVLQLLRSVAERALRLPGPATEVWTMPDAPLRIAPAALTALLLDSLIHAVHEAAMLGDRVTARALMGIFADAGEPLWAMVGRWMKDGMPCSEVHASSAHRAGALDAEFFVEDNELVLPDPDFWAEGFTLRDGRGDEDAAGSSAVPAFLAQAAEQILGAGKAIGLLRALGIAASFDRESERQWMARWPSLKTLLRSFTSAMDTSEGSTIPMGTTAESLSRMVYDELLPECTASQELLTRVLVDDCDLWPHLRAMEDLYLMQRGDAMSHYLDILFMRMDSGRAWNDFHFLNSAFRDVAEAGPHRWIDASLVRFSHRGSRDKSISRTVRAIDGLLIEYAVPFPLTYIFKPATMQVYSSIFSFILQIRRAKSVLERILVRDVLASSPHASSEFKAFYAMRSRLSWFVNTLLNFMATNVLHTQVLKFHEAFRQAKSLDDMIRIHEDHLAKIEGRCLLQRNRAIISILDMSLHFSDCFVAFAGDTTHDISRHSVVVTKRHRSRRQRRQSKNVIGFSQSLREISDSDDTDSDSADLDNENAPEPSFSMGASLISFAEESSLSRLETMSKELDALVRFTRRGVESLAGGTSEAASAFEMFAFSLEDWDG
ncbi:hypothetical protein OBBRIDRAFT_163520 [Obba rivulosa]|uniref:Spindle pole body component n=1 Tax=Obba rivulosa TaxID=1052685 RepID=A0A8E2DR49_9APHY|nr:hypothetical protein OBBRIDRAFT_163520 [Obba rivulosa]